MLKYFILRLWKNPIKKGLFCIILFYPLLEVALYFKDILNGGSVYFPDYAFFLTCNTVGHIFQSLLLWFMPIYCLLLTADDCLEEQKTGYKNILITRCGKKRYIQLHLIKSFFCSFVMIVAALLINLLFVHLIFRGGQFSPYSDEGDLSLFYQWEINHPLLTNLLFTFVTAFFSGLISMVGTINAIMIKNKKVVYGITMLFWFIPFLKEKSIVLLFQPHSEYVLDTLIPIAIPILLVYVIYILIGYFRESHYGKDTF